MQHGCRARTPALRIRPYTRGTGDGETTMNLLLGLLGLIALVAACVALLFHNDRRQERERRF